MIELALLVLATFWYWETIRFAVESFLPDFYASTRVLHPFVVAAAPLIYLWPDWVTSLAVAALVGILHMLVERLAGGPPEPTVIRRPTRDRRGGLPPLPG